MIFVLLYILVDMRRKHNWKDVRVVGEPGEIRNQGTLLQRKGQGAGWIPEYRVLDNSSTDSHLEA